MKCLNCPNFVTAHAFLTGWHPFIFFTVAPFLCILVIPDFCLSSWSLPTLSFGQVCLAHTGSNWKSRILFSMLYYTPEKLSKLWHGNSCFAFRKKFLGFIFFLLLFSCSTYSLSNSNNFTSAKKCQCESCIIDFTLEFTLAIFKKLYFSKYSIKGVVNRLPPFKNLSDNTNKFLMG